MHGYAEILRNVLACRGIKCIIVGADTHEFNQVNIGGKWYYVDLTWDMENINKKDVLRYCLLSQKEFENNRHHKPYRLNFIHPSDESYYIKGEDGERYSAGVYYLKELAEQGDAEAQNRLGVCYLLGDNVNKNIEKGIKLLIESANQGNARAKNNLKMIQIQNKFGILEIPEQLLEFIEEATLTGLLDARVELEQIMSKLTQKNKEGERLR